MPDPDFVKQIRGYSLTTAEILYRLPDHPALLQAYIWQEYDCAPKFPKLRAFLDFWESHLDGALYRIKVAHNRLVRPCELRLVNGEFRLH